LYKGYCYYRAIVNHSECPIIGLSATIIVGDCLKSVEYFPHLMLVNAETKQQAAWHDFYQ